MKISILRSKGENIRDTFEVPVHPGDTVMDVLDYIYENLDHSLAYYRHSRCCQGVCGRCAVKLNGKTVLACKAEIDPVLISVSLDPAPGKVRRDLVTA